MNTVNSNNAMRFHMRKFIATAVFAATAFIAGGAAADGLAANADAIPSAERVTLQADITSFKASNAAAFEAVLNVQGHRPEVYRRFRNPIPMVGRELRRLGQPALLPMLEALAFKAPALDGVTEVEREALTVGMLEAVGTLRDARSSSVLQAVFKADHTTFVTRNAAEAMGQLCDASSLELLSSSLASPKRMASIAGLGECRSVAAAQLLADQLDATTSPAEAARIGQALGVLSSSWAWKTLGAERAAEGMSVRTIASEALTRGFLRFTGEPQDAFRRGLLLAELPTIRVIADANAIGASASVSKRLQGVVKLIEKRTK